MRRAPTTTGRAPRRVRRALLAPLALLAASCVVEAQWTPQPVEPVVEPLTDRVTLTDVACPAPDDCVAVGSLGTVPSGSEALVLRQAGTGWDRVPVSLPVGALRSVSCRAVDDCVVLGGLDLDLALAFDGDGLTVLPTAPHGDQLPGSAVDCVPGGGCLRADGISSAWWDGEAWSAPAPLPAGMMRTDPQLSCTSATACLLVTTEFGIEGWPTPATVTSSTWNGATWSPVVTLDHPTRVLDLDCATPTACFATAGVRAASWTGFGPAGPAEVLRWDGSAWAVVAIGYPGGAVPTEPGTVSCSSPTSCTVLSVAGESNPPSPTVLARWDGATWTGTATDAASPTTALSCPGPADCTATGDGVAQRFDGTAWTATELPSGTSPGEIFSAVSCASDDHCVAVGTGWTLRTPDQGPLLTPNAQRYDGEGWSAEDAGAAILSHVSCGSPTSCMAAGSDLGSVWTRHRDGDGWRTLPTVTGPLVGGLSGLSCPTASWCLMTTSSYSGGGDQAWTWTGGSTWTPIAVLPDRTGSVTAVSCVAPGECVAVSNWIGPAAHRLAGGAWTPVPLDGLDLSGIARFDDVACTATDECVVAGHAGYADSRVQGLLAVLGDGGWSSTVRPGFDMIDVDCWSGDGCVAVASSWTGGRLEVWDGASWRITEGPRGVVRPTGVSCGAPERCEVIGGFVDGDDRAVVAAVVVDA